MRDAITLAFELIWLLTLVLALAVGLLSRHAKGRRLLRRWVRFPTFVWCEAEGHVDQEGDAAALEATLERLRASLPRSPRSLMPRLVTIRIVESLSTASEERTVTVRAATLLQAKTLDEAAERLATALGGARDRGTT